MPAQNGPSAKVKELVAAAGGAIWTTVTDVYAGGAAVAALLIEAPSVPDIARMLLGWRPIENITDSAVDESLLSVFSLSGPNYKYAPQEVICGCLADSYLLTGNSLIAHSEYYDVFAKMKGGSAFNVNAEPVDAIAGNRRSAVELTWSDVQIALPVIYSVCSREIALGAAADIAAGTTFNIGDSHELIEVGGVHTHAAITVEEEITTSLIVKCTNMSPLQELSILLEPVGQVGDEAVDEGHALCHLARRTQMMKFKTETSNVYNDFDVDVALSAAGQGVHYLRWI